MIKYLNAEERILNPFDRSIEPEPGDKGWGALSFAIKNIDAGRHAVEAVLSSDTEDRYGEVVDPKGFEPFMDRFRDNPQLLLCHDHTINIGHWEDMRITAHTFEGWAVFDDRHDKAMEIFRKYEGKHMRAFSVGFIGHEWEMEDRSDGKKKTRRRRFTLQEALEGSACTVPANHTALAKAFARAGVATDESDRPEDAIDIKAIADALRTAARDEIKTTLTQMLNAEPGGPLYQVLCDIADTWHLPAGPGAADDHGDVTPAPNKGHPAVNYLLRR